ncbi:MAG: hypothetical protein COV45_09400 [Deltaproteobacteria bacterium CG11_big_fil_rev_8_21_14_0_20_47_16]|nr:MAG: hypothetical protein COV45_09400 [Deltaproteobacteria bacterium CG11_big_fil_rev_8_21_14_0_20_47_16]
MLSLQNIGHHYQHWVLKDVSMKLRVGQRCILTGANGSGKTTLLKICAGLLTSTQGKRIIDRDTKVSCVLASSFLYAELTVLENLKLYATLQNQKSDVVDWAIHTWGLKSFMQQSVATLSLGQTQRASLARATFSSPNFLCLDEPSNALDAEGLGLLEAYLQSFDGLALIATHDPGSFEPLANTHLRLHDDHRLELR